MDASFCAAASATAASMLKSSPRPPPSPPFCHRIDMPEHSTTPKTTNIKRKASSALVSGNDDAAAAATSSNNSSNQSLCSDGSTLSSSNSSTSSSSSGSLDCQSLQRNLKRIRLSSSPGELRLQLDLRQLVQEDWIQTSEEHWKCLSNGSTLERCHADPLRLVLRMHPSGHIHNNSNSDNMDDVEDISDINLHNGNHTTRTNHQHSNIAVWLQIPRHYPHRPPVITRICHYDDLSSTSAGSMMMIMRSPNNVAASAYSSQSLLLPQHHQQQQQQQHTFTAPTPQRIQSILITADSMNDSSFALYNNISNNAGSIPMAEQLGHSSTNTAVYTGWNPVQRLSDVLQFIHNTLMFNYNDSTTTTMTCAGQSTASESECCTSTTSRQEEPAILKMVTGSVDNRLHYEQQQHQDISEATEATEKSRFLTTQPSRFHHHAVAPSVGTDDNHHYGQLLGHRRVAATREESNLFETRMEDADYKTDLERTFPPNRFDLGYERHLGMDE